MAQTAQKAFPDGRYDTNVSALEAAQPKDLTAAEISVRLGATWLPTDVVERFMYELLNTSGYARERTKVRYSQHLGEWNITEKTAAIFTLSTPTAHSVLTLIKSLKKR